MPEGARPGEESIKYMAHREGALSYSGKCKITHESEEEAPGSLGAQKEREDEEEDIKKCHVLRPKPENDARGQTRNQVWRWSAGGWL